MSRLGILGGTFNPPHVGHLICAQEALVQLELDSVILMPVAAPPHKALADDPGPERRMEMCWLAVGGDERLGVSRLEVDRGGPSYTVHTLSTLAAARRDDELVWIVGGDMAASFAQWRDPEEILRLCTLAVAERAGAGRQEIDSALATVDGGDAVRFFEMPRVDVSSSEVRRRVGAGRPIRYLVPDEVVDYVEAHGLYRVEVPTPR